MNIRGDFPGGNIIVEGMDGSVACLRQDWSTSSGWWFYWCFRVEGVAGRTIRFQFTDGDVFAAGGPCLSFDRKAWRYLGRDILRENGFAVAFPAAHDAAYLSMCVPYVQQDLDEFLMARPAIGRSVLCRSEGGREVELLQLAGPRADRAVFFTVRHHACEAMASFALEGVFDYVLRADEPQAEFLRGRTAVLAVPFVDKDGVERGEQGKSRKPHDHNRDYSDRPIYASVRAIQQLLRGQARRAEAFIDLHCPWIRDGPNEQVFMVGQPEPWQSRVDAFSRALARTQRGEHVYAPSNDIAFGVDWNFPDRKTAVQFAQEKGGVPLATIMELPYARAGGKTVRPDTMRRLGATIARALATVIMEG